MTLYLMSDYSLIMTEKQEKIVKAARSLFAKEGYSATSTSKVAKEAGVSEGLIFKHFGSKEGLLAAIMEQGAAAMKVVMADIVMTADPKEVIRKTLELPFQIDSDEYEMWRLIYALKWQTIQYDATLAEPLHLALNNAFAKLGYADPAAETELVSMLLDGAATALLLHEPANKMDVLEALKSKYQR